MKNENILNQLYTPNDKLGVEMFGVDEWNKCKGRVCGITNAAISRNLKPSGAYDPRYVQLFEVLFNPDRQKFAELLGADAPIDYIPGEWARAVSNIGHGVTEALENVSFFSPWVKAGRSVNQGIASILDKIGLSSKKESDSVSTVKTVGYGLGTVVLIGGGIWAVWYFTRPERKRRRRRGGR